MAVIPSSRRGDVLRRVAVLARACTALAVLAALAPGARAVPAAAASASSHVQEDPGDTALRRAWTRLSDEERGELAEWFRYEVRSLRTFQGTLIEHAIRARGEDVGLAPAARAPRVFDPDEHAPKLPIERTWLKDSSPRLERERERLFGKAAAVELHRAWDYDWGLGQLVRIEGVDAGTILFENALRGLGPDADLALACVEEALDAGKAQEVLEAFGHTYTDRKGNAYTGITLYDAWGSGARIEMPDVDNIGIVNTVLGKQRKWRSPVPERKQESLYAQVGELYTEARRYRGLREALAALYLRAEPPVPAGYDTNRLRLHALWEEASSTPATLAEELPDAKTWQRYLERLLKRVDRDTTLTGKARTRSASLAADERAVRSTLIRVLRESGALDV